MSPVLSLTFDGGPDDVWTPRVLEALDRAGARATFFMAEDRLAGADAIAREMAAAGHEVRLRSDRPRAFRGLLFSRELDSNDRRGDGPASMLVTTRRAIVQGGVVVMHDTLAAGDARHNCVNTIDFIPALIAAARSRGVQVGPLSLQPRRATGWSSRPATRRAGLLRRAGVAV